MSITQRHFVLFSPHYIFSNSQHLADKILGAKLATQKEDASAVVAKINELTSATSVA